jgi:hypothetical protein
MTQLSLGFQALYMTHTSLAGTDVTWLTAHSKPFTTLPQRTLKEAHMQLKARISVIGHHAQAQTLIRLVS